MNDRPDELELTAEERRARDAVRALPDAARGPNADYRARVRERFLAGTLASTVAEVPDGDAAMLEATIAPEAATGRVIDGPWFARPSRWLPLAAAAALVFALGLANRGPAWQVTGATGQGTIRVGGREVPSDAPWAIAQLASRGGRVQLPETVTLDLVAPGHLAVHLAAGSDVQLSGSPNRWIARRSEIRIQQGEVYVSTGRAFRGATLAVVTPEARAEVLGTSFAVMRFPSGTCVCVMEGRVRVESMFDHSTADVEPGQRRFAYATEPAYTDSILENSVHELHRVLEVSGELLAR